MSLPGADPAAALKKIAKEMQEKFDEAGMAKVEEFTDDIDDILDQLKAGPQKIMEEIKAKFEEFTAQLQAGLKDPASLAPGAGGMASCATWYGNSVVANLSSFNDEATKMATSVTELGTAIMEPCNQVEQTLSKAMETLEKSLKALAKLPKLVQKELAGKDSPDDIAKIDTEPMKKALECGDVDGPLGDIMGLKGSIGAAIESVKKGIAALQSFLESAPDAIRSSFDVPAPLCFLTSVLLAQAPQVMKDLLKMVEQLKAINLEPVVKMLSGSSKTICDINADMVKVPMNKFLDSAGDLVGQLDKTVNAAKLSSNPAGAAKGALGSVGKMFG